MDKWNHPKFGKISSHRSQTAAIEKGEPTFVQEIVMLGRDTA
jgi:hypothetical protein